MSNPITWLVQCVRANETKTLTDDEYEPFSALRDRIEVLAASRAGLLAQLANLRQILLIQLMDNLGIQMPSDV